MRESTVGYMLEMKQVLDRLDCVVADEIVQVLVDAWQQGRKIFLCGNGGSAATSSHFACDLAKLTIVEGQKRFKVIALTDNVPLLTAWANDTDYSRVFAEQLIALVEPEDVVLTISGSGKSPNVVRAIEVAKEHGAKTIALTGFEGGYVKALADITLVVPSNSMQIIEDVHSFLTHAISLQLKATVEANATLEELSMQAAV